MQNLSTNKDSKKAIQEALANLGGATSGHESIQMGIRDHKDSFYLKPETRSFAQGAELFSKAAAEEREMATFTRTFDVKPWDGAYVMAATLSELYGYPGIGVASKSMFGETPPAMHVVPTSPRREDDVEVPWGQVEVPDLDAKFYLEATRHERLGAIFQLTVMAPKKMQAAIKGLFFLIDQNCKAKSIYKGKCITSDEKPQFLDVYAATKREDIVYSSQVKSLLEGSLLNVIQYTERARQRGISVRRSILWHGEPGNGKSESANIVAQLAMESDTEWTYIFANSDLESALQLARTYAPAILMLEDVETLTKGISNKQMKDLLEEFDGSTTKGHELIIIGTTNFVGDLYKPFRRRFYKEIEFTALDHEGIIRFLQKKLGTEADPNMDFGACASALDGRGNSYISKSLDFARSLALRNPIPQITTTDLLDAIEATRQEWEAYQKAKARPEEKTFENSMVKLIRSAVMEQMNGAKLIDNDGDEMYEVSF